MPVISTVVTTAHVGGKIKSVYSLPLWITSYLDSTHYYISTFRWEMFGVALNLLINQSAIDSSKEKSKLTQSRKRSRRQHMQRDALDLY